MAPDILCLVSLYEDKTETHRGGGHVMREVGMNAWAVLLNFPLPYFSSLFSEFCFLSTTHFLLTTNSAWLTQIRFSSLPLLASLLPTSPAPHPSLQLHWPLPQMYLGPSTSRPLPMRFLLPIMCNHSCVIFVTHFH